MHAYCLDVCKSSETLAIEETSKPSHQPGSAEGIHSCQSEFLFATVNKKGNCSTIPPPEVQRLALARAHTATLIFSPLDGEAAGCVTVCVS